MSFLYSERIFPVSPPIVVQDTADAMLSVRDRKVERLKFNFRSLSLPEQPQVPAR